jgi:hypothetical protein
MRSEQVIRNRIKKEEILIDSTMRNAVNDISEDRKEKIEAALRECVNINERIMTMKWVLKELSEL